MKRFVGTALMAGLLGMWLLGCSSKKESPTSKAEEKQKVYTIAEAMEMQKNAKMTAPPKGQPPGGSQPPGGGGSASQSKQPVGAAAPPTVSRDLNGKEVKLSDLKGKVVVLDFWATWCPPCRAMIPHTNQLFEKMKGKPLDIVSISGDAKQETLTDFLKTNKMPWTHWWDGQGALSRLYGVSAIPTIYVIDHKGIIRHHQVGGGHEMDAVVEKLVKEAENDGNKPAEGDKKAPDSTKKPDTK